MFKFNFTEEDVKRKWRSLRDQFLKELKKIPSNRSGSSQEYASLYKGKWCYFRSMLFLKDTAIPRRSDGNISDVDETEEIEECNEIDDIDQLSEQNICIDDNISSPPSISITTTQKKNKRSKKQETGYNFEQQLIDLETRKLAALTAPPAQTDDEDMHFFKSILPYFKNMSPIQKLRVRNEIQNILIRENLPTQQSFGTTNSHNQNYILPAVPIIHSSNSTSTYISTPSPSPNFQYSDDTYSSI